MKERHDGKDLLRGLRGSEADRQESETPTTGGDRPPAAPLRGLRGSEADRQESEIPLTGDDHPPGTPLRGLRASEADRQESEIPATGDLAGDVREQPDDLPRTLGESTPGRDEPEP